MGLFGELETGVLKEVKGTKKMGKAGCI